jgi:O-antigen/teichoic acid export membrane protein
MATTDQPNTADPRPAAQRASYRSGFFFATLSFFAVAVLGVLSTILTSRLYGVRIIGQYALAWAPVGALWILSTVKERQALIKEITNLAPRDPRVTQLFAAVFTFSSLFTFLVAGLAAVACWIVFPGPLHAPGLLAPALVNIAGFALLMNTGWNVDSILSAFIAGRQIFWIRLHEVLSFIAVAVAVGLFWRSVWGLVIAIIGASLSSLVHRLIVVRPFLRPRLTRAEYRSGLRVLPALLRFGLKATPGAIAQGVSQQGGIWALGFVAPIAVVGAYSRAQTIPQRLQQASNRVTEVLYPTLVGRHTTGDGEGFDRALIDSIRYEMIGMLLIAAAVGGAAHAVLGVFGPGFERADTAFVLLLLFPALAAVTLTQTQALWATDRPGRTSLIAIARLVVTMGLLVALTPSLGISGPAIALLAGYLTVVVLSGVALRPLLTAPLAVTWPLRQRFALGASYAAGFLAAHAVEHLIASTAAIPLDLLAGAGAYAATFYICAGVNRRDRDRAAQLIESLRSRRAASRAPMSEQVAACAE